jgi:hypothetical protein
VGMGSLTKANANQWVFLNFLFAKVVNSSLETIFWTQKNFKFSSKTFYRVLPHKEAVM